MEVTLSAFKLNTDKFIDLAEDEDVIIIKHGKPALKIVRFDDESWYTKQIPDEITSVEQLFGTLPSDIELDKVKSERLHCFA